MVSATLQAMLYREDAYLKGDYIFESKQTRSTTGTGRSSIAARHDVAHLDTCFRREMILWCYQVFDHCKFNRETVEIVVSYIDRYCWNSLSVDDRSSFQLCTITCLYIAVKTHASNAMHPRILSKLSRDVHSEQQITDSEQRILSVLNWYLNPPTIMSFVRLLMQQLIDNKILELNERMLICITERCRYQAEAATIEYSFMTIKASIVAYASILNSLDVNSSIPYDTQRRIGFYLANQIGISYIDPKVCLVQRYLHTATMEKLYPSIPLQLAQHTTAGKQHSNRRELDKRDGDVNARLRPHNNEVISPKCSMLKQLLNVRNNSES